MEPKPTVTFTDWSKLDLRIGTVKAAERLDNSEKLIKLTVDFADFERTILAGIAPIVEEPSTLIGRQLPFIVNLEPRPMAGSVSEGMMLAPSTHGKPVLFNLDSPVEPGSQIR